MVRLNPLTLAAIILLAVALFAGLIWVNYRAASFNSRGDLFVGLWVAARSLMFDGNSPYTPGVTAQIEQKMYGRSAQDDEPSGRVMYPLYASFLFLPYALIGDVLWARAVWLTVLEAALLIDMLAAIRLTGWRPPSWLLLLNALFSIFWLHGLAPLLDGSPVILAGLFFVLALLSLRAGRDELAGILCALATIQPVTFLLPLLFLLLWSFAQRRWALVVAFLGALAVLITVGMFIIPDWPLQYLRQILNFPLYTPQQTLGAAFAAWAPGIGRQAGWGVTLIVSIILCLEGWLALGRGWNGLLWTLSLILVLSQWIGLPASPLNFVLLTLPLTLIFAVLEDRFRLAGRAVAVMTIGLLGFGLWAVYWRTTLFANGLQLPAGLFIPVPLLLFVGLYWIRWWAIRPRRLFVEILRERFE